MRKLYVLSKPINNKPRLIGELAEENGVYEFKYRLGKTLPEWFLLIDEFPDINKVYTGVEVEKFISRRVPKEDDEYIKNFLSQASLIDYDKWELLRYYGKFNARQDAYIYENLPKEVIIYE